MLKIIGGLSRYYHLIIMDKRLEYRSFIGFRIFSMGAARAFNHKTNGKMRNRRKLPDEEKRGSKVQMCHDVK